MGYWDGQGFGDLVPGDAITQTSAVDEMIASEGTASHYSDYSQPVDYYPEMKGDLSEPPSGDEHPDECVADYMRTSQSAYGNYYGWSWFSAMRPAMESYVYQALGSEDYLALTENLRFWDGSLTWAAYQQEIDAGRPVVFLVDTDADGSTDHFVTAMGYADIGGVPHYGCRNTWDTGVHWFEFAELASGQSWGIYGATTLRIVRLNAHVYLPMVTRQS